MGFNETHPRHTKVAGHLTEAIHAHNAIVIAANTWGPWSEWIDCSEFEKIAVSLKNDAQGTSQVDIQWSFDGATRHTSESVLAAEVFMLRSAITDVKAPYFAITAKNGDATPHTIDLYVFLRA